MEGFQEDNEDNQGTSSWSPPNSPESALVVQSDLRGRNCKFVG